MKKWLAVQAAAVMLGMTMIQTAGEWNEAHVAEAVQQQLSPVSAGAERLTDGKASLDEIKKQYGTYNEFFEKVLSVTAQDREQLKTMYLEAPGITRKLFSYRGLK